MAKGVPTGPCSEDSIITPSSAALVVWWCSVVRKNGPAIRRALQEELRAAWRMELLRKQGNHALDELRVKEGRAAWRMQLLRKLQGRAFKSKQPSEE